MGDELRPSVFKLVSLARPAVERVVNLLVRAADCSCVILQHGLVHVPVLDQRKELAGAKLPADVADHFHQLLFCQKTILHGLCQSADGFHRVDDGAGRLCRLIRFRRILLDNIAQTGDLARCPCDALVDFGFGIADNVQKQRAQRTGRFAACPLRDRRNRADGGCQFIDADMHLLRDRRDDSHAFCDLLDAGGIFVVDFVRSVKNGGQLLDASLVFVSSVNGKQELICRLCRGISDDLRLRGQLGQRCRLLFVTCARICGDRFQIVCRTDAICACRGICLLLDSRDLRIRETSNLADRDEFIVHFPHGIERFAHTPHNAGKSVADDVPPREFLEVIPQAFRFFCSFFCFLAKRLCRVCRFCFGCCPVFCSGSGFFFLHSQFCFLCAGFFRLQRRLRLRCIGLLDLCLELRVGFSRVFFRSRSLFHLLR